MFNNLKSKFPNSYNSGLTDEEINYALTPFSENDYREFDIQKFIITRDSLIKCVSHQDTLITPGLDKLRYEHLKLYN